MRKVNVHHTKTHLSEILVSVERGEKYVICRNGEPVADLVPHRRSNRVRIDPFLSRVEVKGDLTQPVAEGAWEAGA